MRNYEELKKGTPKAENAVYCSRRYAGHDLTDVYSKFSKKKKEIYDDWRYECIIGLDGYNYHISSYNRDKFTLGFETDTHFYYITPTHNYRVEK